MIKIRKFNEEFYNGIKYGEYHEIFVNPTKKELDIIYNEVSDYEGYESIRFIAKNDTKQLFVFNGDILHYMVAKKIFNMSSREMFDASNKLLSGIMEGDDYIVTDSDSLMADINALSDNAYMYIKFVLETDWTWIDKYIIFSPWWKAVAIPNLKKQLEDIEKYL